MVIDKSQSRRIIATDHPLNQFIFKIICNRNEEKTIDITRNIHRYEQERRNLIRIVENARVYQIGHPRFNALMFSGDIEIGNGIYPEYRYDNLAVYPLQVWLDKIVIKTVLTHDEVENTVRYVKFS